MLIGRNEEYKELLGLFESPKSEFVAVYGRRRVGKTFLIRETFKGKFTFQHTGILDATMKEQLEEFRVSLFSSGMKKCPKLNNWHEAFHALEQHLDSLSDGKKVIFIDEMPWMDTTNSNFVRALDHFWNGWASARQDILLVVCGSATSWIIKKIVLNHGGLHNRITRQILLRPFSLAECEEYCKYEKMDYTRKQILEAYMILGGIPYYWSLLRRGKSIAQNIDKLFFSESGDLKNEFDALYASLFRNPEPHLAIIKALTTRRAGLSRDAILQLSKLIDNSTFEKAMGELQLCGFIRKYTCMGKKNKDSLYQLMDNYTLFYYKFIIDNDNSDGHFWSSVVGTPRFYAWAGLAFERVCLQHLEQIKKGLGFSAVACNAYSWSTKAKGEDSAGSQIDLIIDRNDNIINLCEMKFCDTTYTITKDEDARLRQRKSSFIETSKTRKAVMTTFITTYGLTPGNYANEIPCQATMDSLFDTGEIFRG